MKRKLLISILSLATIVCAVIGLSACHEHTYGNWKYDAEYHWKEATCEDAEKLSEKERIGEKAKHNFIDGNCECGLALSWNSDTYYHWKEVVVDGKVVVLNEKTVHNLQDYACPDCGYKVQFKYDKESHWFKYKDANGEEVSERAQHSFQNNKCTLCDYTDTWDYDEEHHWKSINADNGEQRVDIAEHTLDGNVCTVCNALVGMEYKINGYVCSECKATNASYVNKCPECEQEDTMVVESYTLASLGTETKTDIIIPEKYKDAPVTKIGWYAFANKNITSVTIPASVTQIGREAFYGCTSLQTVTLNSGLESILTRAFYGCTALEKIELPVTLTSLGDGAFKNCSKLSEVTLPAIIKSLHRETFTGCNSLTEITFNGTSTQWNLIPKDDNWKDATTTVKTQ